MTVRHNKEGAFLRCFPRLLPMATNASERPAFNAPPFSNSSRYRRRPRSTNSHTLMPFCLASWLIRIFSEHGIPMVMEHIFHIYFAYGMQCRALIYVLSTPFFYFH